MKAVPDTLSSNRDEIILRAWSALKGATWGIMAGIGDKAPAGASPGHMGFLHALNEAGGSAPPGTLAKRLDLTAATVTGAITTMEELGLVTRDRDPDDRRGVVVSITAKGRSVQKEWGQKIMAILRARLGPLTDAELEKIAEILGTVAPPIHGPPRGMMVALRHESSHKGKRASGGRRSAKKQVE